MKLQQLKAGLAKKSLEVRNLINESKVEDADAAMKEVRDLEKQIQILEEIEEREKSDLERQKKEKKNPSEEKPNEYRSIVKSVMGAETTEEERAVITTSDNAAVLPDEFINKLQIIQKGYGSLKEYCDVIPVNKNQGTIPVVDLDQNELADVLEGQDIVDGEFATTDIPYSVGKVGLINTLTSELVDDAEVEIEGLVKKNFANIATVKENKKIIKVLTDNAVAVTPATSYEDIELTIDKSLPSVKLGLVTVTNTTGYAHLKNLKDENGRSLNLVTTVNGVEVFHGKPLVTVDDDLLTPSENKTHVFYVGNLKEAIKFVQRKGVTIARSTEAGFNNDTVKLRILERIGVVKGSVRSLKKIEF